MAISKLDFIEDAFIISSYQNAKSVSDLLRRLGYSTYGSNSKTVQKRLNLLGLSFRELAEKGESFAREAGKTGENQLPRSKSSLKQYLIKNEILPYRCSDQRCINPEPNWNGEQLILVLDHIDGNPSNNDLKNLRFLCPNCNSQTKTFGGKNRTIKTCLKCQLTTNLCVCPKQKKISWPTLTEIQSLILLSKSFVEACRKIGCSPSALTHHLEQNGVKKSEKGVLVKREKIEKIKNCPCGKRIYQTSTRCASCTAKLQKPKIEWPDAATLHKLVWDKPTVVLGLEFGVSDKAIDYKCKIYGISKPPRGYWSLVRENKSKQEIVDHCAKFGIVFPF